MQSEDTQMLTTHHPPLTAPTHFVRPLPPILMTLTPYNPQKHICTGTRMQVHTSTYMAAVLATHPSRLNFVCSCVRWQWIIYKNKLSSCACHTPITVPCTPKGGMPFLSTHTHTHTQIHTRELTHTHQSRFRALFRGGCRS